MLVKESTYIFPPRPKNAIPLREVCLFADMGWEAQLKFNGARCLIKYTSANNIELWNRHGSKLRSYSAPDWLIDQLWQVHKRLNLNPKSWSLLDGELIDFKHCAIKDTIAIWDILVRDGHHLLGTTYRERYDLVKAATDGTMWFYTNPQKPTIHPPLEFGLKVTDHILVPINYKGNRSSSADNDGNPSGDAWKMVWEQIVDVANAPYTTTNDIKPIIEGLVLKMPTHKLKMGYSEDNNHDWMMRCRVETKRHRF